MVLRQEFHVYKFAGHTVRHKRLCSRSQQAVENICCKAGLRKTIFLIIIPLSLLGLVSLLLFASSMHFPWLRIAINCIPFICLIIVALSMQQRKSIIPSCSDRWINAVESLVRYRGLDAAEQIDIFDLAATHVASPVVSLTCTVETSGGK